MDYSKTKKQRHLKDIMYTHNLMSECWLVFPQVTRLSSYSKKSDFHVEKEDIEKLEIKWVVFYLHTIYSSVPCLKLTEKNISHQFEEN